MGNNGAGLPLAVIGRCFLPAAVCILGQTGNAAAAGMESIVCHYSYGGETRRLVALPVESEYGVGTVEVGSYFRFRVVFQNRPVDLASVKIYTYADRDDGAVLIHQATYPYPLSAERAKHGFTGLHYVYEPVRDGEMQYWCEWIRRDASAGRGRQ